MLFLHVLAGGVKPERVFCTFSLRSCHSNLRAAGPVHSNLAYGEDERGGGVMGGWGELGWAGVGWGGEVHQGSFCNIQAQNVIPFFGESTTPNLLENAMNLTVRSVSA